MGIALTVITVACVQSICANAVTLSRNEDFALNQLISYAFLGHTSNESDCSLKMQNGFNLLQRYFSNYSNQHSRISNVERDAELNCIIDLGFWIVSLMEKKYWAFEVIDSWGKVRSGVLRGNALWIGNYEQCLNISVQGEVNFIVQHLPHVAQNASFTGQYCTVIFKNQSSPSTASVVNGKLKNGIRIGKCLPASCSDKKLLSLMSDLVGLLYNDYLNIPNMTFEGVECFEKEAALDSLAITTIIIICVLISITFLATLLHWNLPIRHKSSIVEEADTEVSGTEDAINGPSGINPMPLISDDLTDFSPFRSVSRISVCFSLKHNIHRLLSTQYDSKAGYLVPSVGFYRDLNVLHGLRFLSLAWIILGHTYFLSFAITENPLDLLDPYAHNILYQIIVQGPYAVDTFFILSGVLLSYNFFKATEIRVDSVGKATFWIKFYVCRILRLTPLYMFVLLVYMALFKYMGDGPFWPQDGLDTKYCRSIWWRNLLYINNLFDYRDPVDPQALRICVGWTWYLAVDMQLFVLSPIILYPLLKSRACYIFKYISAFIVLASVFGGLLATSLLVSLRGLPPNLLPANINIAQKARDLEVDVYFKPYPHIVCYVVGILVGYYCFFRDQYAALLRLSKVMVTIFWLLSFVLASLVIFGIWPLYRGHVYSQHVSAFYFGCSRVAWSFSIGWIIFASRFGYAGCIGQFLNSHYFVPLSRLTYCAYLLHPMLMFVYFFGRRTTLHYTDFTMVWFFGSFVVFTFVASSFFTLLIDSPVGALRKIFS